jgi:tetratricopeptide (TPR) repeat protein
MKDLHMWCRILMLALVAALSLTAMPDQANAQDDKARAVELIKEANVHTEAGEHRPALMKYKVAFDIMEDPRILYRIGLSYEQLGNYQRAREHLELYLFADPDSEYKDRIDKKIALLKEKEETMRARIEISSNPSGAQIFVDGENNKAYGKTPLVLPVGPGEHSLTLRKGNAKKSIRIDVGEGETATETVELGSRALEAANGTDGENVEEVVTTENEGSGTPMGERRGIKQVDIAPPSYLLAVGWGLITISSAMFVAWGVSNADNAVIAYSIAAASLLGGGYILWFGADSYVEDNEAIQRIGIDATSQDTRIWGGGYRWQF